MNKRQLRRLAQKDPKALRQHLKGARERDLTARHLLLHPVDLAKASPKQWDALRDYLSAGRWRSMYATDRRMWRLLREGIRRHELFRLAHNLGFRLSVDFVEGVQRIEDLATGRVKGITEEDMKDASSVENRFVVEPVFGDFDLSQDKAGMWTADFPSIPGCVGQGKTDAEALKNLQEAISRYQATQILKRQTESRVFRGTSVPVTALVEHFRAGGTIDEFLAKTPGVTREQCSGVLAAIIESLEIERKKPHHWFALVSGGEILQETLATDRVAARKKFTQLCGKLPHGYAIRPSTGEDRPNPTWPTLEDRLSGRPVSRAEALRQIQPLMPLSDNARRELVMARLAALGTTTLDLSKMTTEELERMAYELESREPS